ncbi:MAG: S41 family peptidase [Gemmatimonas sp.]
MTGRARRGTWLLKGAMLMLAVIVPLVGTARAQSSALSAPERRKIQDILDAVRKQLLERYYDSTYAGVNMQAAYDSASAHIRSAVDPDAGLGAIAWFALQLNDSHTYFAPPAQTLSADYGWNMAMFGDSCLIISVKPESDAARQGVHVGDRLISINGIALTRDNLWQLSYVYRLLRPQPSLRVVISAPGGDARALELAAKVHQRSAIIDLTGADGGRDINQLLRDGDNDRESMESQVVDYGDQVVIWKMPTFIVPLDAIRAAVRQARKRRALVIDLRGNGGGYVQSMLEMVKQVDRDSVVVGSLRERHKSSALVAKGGGADAFAGKLFVLVDNRSASASEMFARTMQLAGRGTVIGDRTAGAVMVSRYYPLSIGMETRIFFGVQVTDADVIMSDGGRLERVGVTPDELLIPASTDLASNRDPALARALTLAGVPTDAAKAGTLLREMHR